jgi:hypothetical protein
MNGLYYSRLMKVVLPSNKAAEDIRKNKVPMPLPMIGKRYNIQLAKEDHNVYY